MTMTGTPEPLIGTPAQPGADRAAVLADVLRHIRLTGSVFLTGEYSSAWALESPESADIIRMLAPQARRLILFHFVREGEAWFGADGHRVAAAAGELVVLPHAHRHVMGSHEPAVPVPIAGLLPPLPWETMPVCRCGGGGAPTRIVCGYLQSDEPLFNPILRQLPPIFRVAPPAGPMAGWVDACVDYALHRSGQPAMADATLMARLPELLLAEILRLHCEQQPRTEGWLAAIADPVVGRALCLMHADPAASWTVEALARRAATSRSVLDERFRRLLGQPPIRYHAEWRMQLATGLLRDTRMKVAAIAERVGYASEEAFSRAFQRHVGCAPAHWRASAADSQASPLRPREEAGR